MPTARPSLRPRPRLRLAAWLLAGLAAAAPAAAGEIADAGAQAEKLVQEGKPREAFDLLARAADAVAAAAPLEFRTLVQVAGEPQGYGVYVPRASDVYKPGEPILVYGEPFGFGYGRQADISTIEFEVRLGVSSPAGQEIIPPRTGKLSLQSRHRNREFMLYFKYEPRGLKPGDYVLTADFRDTATGKTAAARLPFRIE